ncbi:hypothetical protein [Noviherbaspirillum galbum]|uniref:Uncharacterized protein n=1 Tax=Noviherbaspirillum galbum TaxID=2709383 RepID=A0A6B3SNU6_9BURK|nr:hypothetical protein [Noviherbaspirillum galbum]NEX62540.1 hypothetical protein [Noviherbaspirillum galbum]
MSNLQMKDLASVEELDGRAMAEVRGGNDAAAAWLKQMGPVANVNVGVNQNITQLQNIEVNALNNVGVIGAGFVAPNLTVSPSQWAAANLAL